MIPFELISRHIFVRIKVNNSDPLWFIFDTGDKLAIIDLERAKSLGLDLQGQVNVGGDLSVTVTSKLQALALPDVSVDVQVTVVVPTG